MPWKVPSGAGIQVVVPDALFLTAEDSSETSINLPSWQHLPGPTGEFIAAHNYDQRVIRGRIVEQTGSLGELNFLESSTVRDSNLWNEHGQPSLVDLDSEGRLALFAQVPEGQFPSTTTTGVIRVWPDRNSPQPLPAAIECTLDRCWLGWGLNGRLLLMHGGKLAAWNATTGQRVLEFPGSYPGIAALAPSRKWIVLPTEGGYLEVLDTGSGERLGRMKGKGPYVWLAVSFDGQRLAGVSRTTDAEPTELHVWDLNNGKQVAAMPIPRHWHHRLIWLDGNRLTLLQFSEPADCDAYLVDTSAQSVIGQLRIRGHEGPKPLLSSPDGRLWWTFTRFRFTAPIPEVTPGPNDLVRGTTVAVEASTGNAARDQQLAAALTALAAQQGFVVGAGQWKFRAQVAVEDEGAVSMENGQSIRTPAFRGAIELVAPDGSAIAKVDNFARFSGETSRYRTSVARPSSARPFRGTDIVTITFNFQGLDPRTAMEGETWERFIGDIPKLQLPCSARHADGKYTTQMRTIELVAPPAVDRLLNPRR